MNKDPRINRTRPFPHQNQELRDCTGGSPPPNNRCFKAKSYCKLCEEEIDGWTITSEDLCRLMGFNPIFCFPGNLGKSSNPSLNPSYSVSYEEVVGVNQDSNSDFDRSSWLPEFVEVPIFVSWLNEELADVLLAACFKLFEGKGYGRLRPKIVFQLTFDSEEEIDSLLRKKSKLINVAKAMKSNGHKFEFWIIDYTDQNSHQLHQWDWWPKIDWDIIN